MTGFCSKVFAETSNPIVGSAINGIFSTSSQSAHCKVIVEQGQPFLISGQFRDRQTLSQSEVPFLQDITLFCMWFQPKSSSGKFDHILAFVIPTQVNPERHQNLQKTEDLNRTSSLSH